MATQVCSPISHRAVLPLPVPPPPPHLDEQTAAQTAAQTTARPISTPEAGSADYQALIRGAVLFDSDGLPQAYFVDRDRPSDAWEETVFKLLGLRWLLMSSLGIEHFSYAQAHCGTTTTVVVRQEEHCLALLLEGCPPLSANPPLLQWLLSFDVTRLSRDRRFYNP